MHRINQIVFIVFLFSTLPVFSQTLEDAKRLHSEAVELYNVHRDYRNALSNEMKAMPILAEHSKKQSSLYGESLYLTAMCYDDLDSIGIAIDCAEKALSVFESIDELGTAKTFSLLGSFYAQNDELEKSLDLGNKGARIIEKYQMPEDSLYAVSLIQQSYYYEAIEDYTTAIDLCAKANIILKQKYVLSDDYALSEHRLAVMYSAIGDLANAIFHSLNGVLHRTSNLGEEHTYTISSVRNHIDIYANILIDSLEIDKGIMNACDSLFLEVYNPHLYIDILIENAINNGAYDYAIYWGTQAQAIARRLYGIQSEQYLTASSNLGVYYQVKIQERSAKRFVLDSPNIF